MGSLKYQSTNVLRDCGALSSNLIIPKCFLDNLGGGTIRPNVQFEEAFQVSFGQQDILG